MNNGNKIWPIVLIMVLYTVTACTVQPLAIPTPPPQPADTPAVVEKTVFKDVLWKLDGYVNSKGESVGVLPGTEITIEFKADQMKGNAGCNTYFGPYEIDGDSLTIGQIGATMMACEPPVNEQEAQYLASLEGAAAYQITDDNLEIANAGGETVLTFSVLEPTPLTGTTWRLTGYNNGKGGFVSLLRGTEVTAVFGEDGSLGGSAGCNEYTASYEVEGETISIGPAGATRMMCAEPEGIMEQESAYLAALESAVTYQIRGDSLEVRNAGGMRTLSYTAETGIGMPNPASVYCEEQGGRLEIRTEEGGEAGYCIFPDGSECEEWAFFRGECQPGQTEASTEDLIAIVQATLPEGAFENFQVLPLTVPAGSQPLWAVFSYGRRNYDLDPPPGHLVAVYTQTDAGWQELASLELASDDRDVLMPDYMGDTSVSQAQIDPSRVWLEVHGGVGAHSGTYHLLSFDGDVLQIEAANFSASPGAGWPADVDDDGTPEVVLNQTDPYVFCYACGVRQIQYQVLAWNSADQRLSEVNVQPLPAEQQAHPAYEPANRAAELAKAGLWEDALTKITEAKDAAAQAAEPADTRILDWDYALIKFYAEAMAQDIEESAYPLLANVFYGDYAAALDLMRPYTPEQLFSLDSPLIADTAAEGWESQLADYVIESTTSALSAEPRLAEAYFLRGWAERLKAQVDIARAAELAPEEPLFTPLVR